MLTHMKARSHVFVLAFKKKPHTHKFAKKKSVYHVNVVWKHWAYLTCQIVDLGCWQFFLDITSVFDGHVIVRLCVYDMLGDCAHECFCGCNIRVFARVFHAFLLREGLGVCHATWLLPNPPPPSALSPGVRRPQNLPLLLLGLTPVTQFTTTLPIRGSRLWDLLGGQ